MPLTDTHIRSLKPDVKPRKYFDGGGLFLFVPANGSKLWRMAYRFDGKSKLLSFGEYPTVSLKDARERREEAKRMLSRGIDPSDHKRQLRQARAIAERDSFQNIAREWHETRMAEFSEKHQGTVMYRLETYIFPAIGKTHIAKLETRDVMEVVKPLEQRGNYETSRRVLQIISQVFRYAVITGRAKHNVAADLRGALRPRKTVHRAAVLEPEKVGQLLRDIDAYEGYFPLVCATQHTTEKKQGGSMKEDSMTDRDVCISIGKIEGDTQVTSNDTGWSEEEKERMRQYGYDDMDIIRAWYS
ncbi:tyrosine-type recombinase/integrase [Bilophila wadsworthia]|uniref:tyrosine-type recombinase/integrase n=3 Tax=Bilophila wadsworthia TaxID=35833 RepID=UPI0028E8F125|nr:integrase arm-type DNA-binding domain-containing protein [Bilophila wadsworthia]